MSGNQHQQMGPEGETRVIVKAADMAQTMQQEAINVAIEVRCCSPPCLVLVCARLARCRWDGLLPTSRF